MEFKLTLVLDPPSINVSVVSGNKENKWTEINCSGLYSFAETVNDRPVYKVKIVSHYTGFTHQFSQRNEKDSDGDEIFIWYNSSVEGWSFCDGDRFRAKNNEAVMKFKSKGKKISS